MKLTEIAIKRPAFMAMIFTALAVLGLYSYMNMGVDLLPKMDWPMVFVSTIYPGAGPKEVETEISKPIEEAISSINGIKSVRSYSQENVSLVWVEFNMSVDVNVAVNDVERKISEVQASLPTDARQPIVSKADINSLPILRVALTSSIPENEFYQFIKDNVKTKLEQVEGVAKVEIVGGKIREIRVEIDNDKLKAYNLSLLQVTQIINAENLDFPTGKIYDNKKDFIVRVEGKYKDLKSIEETIISDSPNGKILLKDVAKVYDTFTQDYSLSRLTDKECVGIIITKASDANAVKTSELIRKKMTQLEELYANQNLKFEISQDITDFTKNSIEDVMRDLSIAIIMVALILFLFLHDFKNSLIVLLSIPTSLVSTFILMNIFGFTVNIVTMLGLTLVIGILVDDSIVVLENIHRHLDRGEEPVNAAIKGRGEIGLAAIAITLVDVVVFLPIAMVSGIVGKIFREFGLTIVVATLFSLFISFTLTPLLASRLSRVVHYVKESLLGKFIAGFENFFQKISNGYRTLLIWSLGHRKTIVIISVVLFIFSIMIVGSGAIGLEFMPQLDRGEFAINIDLPLGTSIEITDSATKKIEKYIKAMPEVEQYYSMIGRHEVAWGNAERSYYSQIQIKLKKGHRPTQEIITEVLAKANSIPGVIANGSLIGMFGSADESPIMIEVRGLDLDKIVPASELVQDIMTRTNGARDVRSSWEEGQPEVKVILDRNRCGTFGLTVAEAATALRNAFEGDINSKFRSGDTEYDIRILLSKDNRNNPKDVSDFTIQNRMGQMVKLSEIANVYLGKGPSQIARKDRSRVISLTANLDDTRSLNDVLNDIKTNVEKLNLAKDIEVFYTGSAEDMNNMVSDMMLAILFAILFVYMIMVSLFESFIHPFTIMFSLPVALFGGFAALALTGQNFNMFSMIGLLLSLGLVTKNAILLVDYTNTLRAQGIEMKDALIQAGPIRLRPIVMTTATMVFGMLPLAIGAGSGGEFRTGLAVIVIGALISSTLLTLVLVPVIYTYMDGIRTRLAKRKREKGIKF